MLNLADATEPGSTRITFNLSKVRKTNNSNLLSS